MVQRLEQKRAEKQAEIESVKTEMNLISSNLNILSYLSDSPTLLRELTCYWVEGDYTNDNIAILDDTTDEQAVALMNELMETGKIELAKVCQPRLSFSLSAVDFTKQYEFHRQAAELELGRIVAVEKDDGIWFYPALLEIDMDLDSAESFELTFANALTLNDWGYSYADLISEAASTSRQVSANWQNMMSYSKAKDDLASLVKAPLSATLRSSFANATNQEFTVDSTGILGRKLKSGASNAAKVFEDEQLRILNNLLLFTDDGWKTAKTALGKVTYTDESGNEHTSYGLVAETILGSLIMSNALQIRNESNTVNLGVDGMTIRQPDGTVVFRATSDVDLSVTGVINATSGTIGGWAIGEECIHTVSGVYGNWIGADTANNSTVRTTGYLFTFLMFRSGLLYRVYEDNSVDSTLQQ